MINDYLEYLGKESNKYKYKCKYCGEIVFKSISPSSIKPNSTCGNKNCLKHQEIQSSCRRKLNKYDLSGEFGIGYTNKGEQFLFDLEDYEKISKYTWYKDSEGYIRTNTFDYDTCKRGYTFLHNFVLDFTPNKNFYIDHIGGSETIHDNRKANLRVVTISENNINQQLRKDNTSGYKGINWSKVKNKWTARIQTKNKRVYLGDFDKLEDAVKARKIAEQKYHKEYSYEESQIKYHG